MMIPILSYSPLDVLIRDSYLYAMTINQCNYFSSLFNNRSIVMDTTSSQYIDYNKYNALPIVFEENYCHDQLGVVNIHDMSVLQSYLKKYGEDPFILSTSGEFLRRINLCQKMYLLYSGWFPSYHERLEFDAYNSRSWIIRDTPVYEDNDNMLLIAYNIPRIHAIYQEELKRPMYLYEKEYIISLLKCGKFKEENLPSSLPLINI